MFAIYCTLFKTAFAQHLQYRASLLIWLMGFMLEPVVYMVVWMTVAQSHGGSVGGFSTSDLALYYLAAMLINHLTFDWHLYEMEFRVRLGSFSPMLLRPLHPIHNDLAENITYKVLTFPFMFAAAAGLFWYFGPVLKTPLWAAALFVPVLVLGFAMRFLLEWTLALAAFWTTRVQAVNSTYLILSVFLSCRMAPLALLPKTLQRVIVVLPFRLWMSFPIELLLGRLTPEEAGKDVALQVLWIGLLYGLFRCVWHNGMKRYSAVGA